VGFYPQKEQRGALRTATWPDDFEHKSCAVLSEPRRVLSAKRAVQCSQNRNGDHIKSSAVLSELRREGTHAKRAVRCSQNRNLASSQKQADSTLLDVRIIPDVDFVQMVDAEVPKKAKPRKKLCFDSKGKFTRCFGAPRPKRVHRKRRVSWEGCGCPEGSERVVNTRKGGRGWSCVAKTKDGPRFVTAKCADGK
jgi:hypothetical protein